MASRSSSGRMRLRACGKRRLHAAADFRAWSGSHRECARVNDRCDHSPPCAEIRFGGVIGGEDDQARRVSRAGERQDPVPWRFGRI